MRNKRNSAGVGTFMWNTFFREWEKNSSLPDLWPYSLSPYFVTQLMHDLYTLLSTFLKSFAGMFLYQVLSQVSDYLLLPSLHFVRCQVQAWARPRRSLLHSGGSRGGGAWKKCVFLHFLTLILPFFVRWAPPPPPWRSGGRGGGGANFWGPPKKISAHYPPPPPGYYRSRWGSCWSDTRQWCHAKERFIHNIWRSRQHHSTSSDSNCC